MEYYVILKSVCVGYDRVICLIILYGCGYIKFFLQHSVFQKNKIPTQLTIRIVWNGLTLWYFQDFRVCTMYQGHI